RRRWRRCHDGLRAGRCRRLRERRRLGRFAAQLRDLALRERSVDAIRELLDVELEIVRIVAVLDRAPELQLSLLLARPRRCRSRCGRRRSEVFLWDDRDRPVFVLVLWTALQALLQGQGERARRWIALRYVLGERLGNDFVPYRGKRAVERRRQHRLVL